MPADPADDGDVRWRLAKVRARRSEDGRVEERLELGASSSDYEVAELSVTLPTQPRLGIELVELEGTAIVEAEGKPSTQALTVVRSLVEGGNAWRRAADEAAASELGAIAPGDVIVAVGSGDGDVLGTELLGYDALSDAIASVAAGAAELVLVVKRLVRRKRALVTAVLPSGEERNLTFYDGENLRLALIRRGLTESVNDKTAERYDNKPAGSGNCGGQGICATCVVGVLAGAEHLTPRTPTENQLLRNVARWRMSCRARIALPADATDVDMRIELAPRAAKRSSTDSTR